MKVLCQHCFVRSMGGVWLRYSPYLGVLPTLLCAVGGRGMVTVLPICRCFLPTLLCAVGERGMVTVLPICQCFANIALCGQWEGYGYGTPHISVFCQHCFVRSVGGVWLRYSPYVGVLPTLLCAVGGRGMVTVLPISRCFANIALCGRWEGYGYGTPHMSVFFANIALCGQWEGYGYSTPHMSVFCQHCFVRSVGGVWLRYSPYLGVLPTLLCALDGRGMVTVLPICLCFANIALCGRWEGYGYGTPISRCFANIALCGRWEGYGYGTPHMSVFCQHCFVRSVGGVWLRYSHISAFCQHCFVRSVGGVWLRYSPYVSVLPTLLCAVGGRGMVTVLPYLGVLPTLLCAVGGRGMVTVLPICQCFASIAFCGRWEGYGYGTPQYVSVLPALLCAVGGRGMVMVLPNMSVFCQHCFVRSVGGVWLRHSPICQCFANIALCGRWEGYGYGTPQYVSVLPTLLCAVGGRGMVTVLPICRCFASIALCGRSEGYVYGIPQYVSVLPTLLCAVGGRGMVTVLPNMSVFCQHCFVRSVGGVWLRYSPYVSVLPTLLCAVSGRGMVTVLPICRCFANIALCGQWEGYGYGTPHMSVFCQHCFVRSVGGVWLRYSPYVSVLLTLLRAVSGRGMVTVLPICRCFANIASCGQWEGYGYGTPHISVFCQHCFVRSMGGVWLRYSPYVSVLPTLLCAVSGRGMVTVLPICRCFANIALCGRWEGYCYGTPHISVFCQHCFVRSVGGVWLRYSPICQCFASIALCGRWEVYGYGTPQYVSVLPALLCAVGGSGMVTVLPNMSVFCQHCFVWSVGGVWLRYSHISVFCQHCFVRSVGGVWLRYSPYVSVSPALLCAVGGRGMVTVLPISRCFANIALCGRWEGYGYGTPHMSVFCQHCFMRPVGGVWLQYSPYLGVLPTLLCAVGGRGMVTVLPISRCFANIALCGRWEGYGYGTPHMSVFCQHCYVRSVGGVWLRYSPYVCVLPTLLCAVSGRAMVTVLSSNTCFIVLFTHFCFAHSFFYPAFSDLTPLSL